MVRPPPVVRRYAAEHDPFLMAPGHVGRTRRLVRRNNTLGPLPLLNEFAMDRHPEYKYLLNLDGHSYSHRLVKLLATNSLVIKEETPDVEYFYHMLQPGVHYLPFHFKSGRCCDMRRVETDLLEVVKMATQRDAEMRKIAEQAHALVHTHLCDAARRCYIYELLRRYGKAMTYKPSLEERPGALRITDRRELLSAHPRSWRGVGYGTADSNRRG